MELDLFSQMTSPETQTKRLESQILALRDRAISYGLVISQKDASAIAAVGVEQLHEQERVEFAQSAVVKIISKFMESGYISQQDFVETISELIGISTRSRRKALISSPTTMLYRRCLTALKISATATLSFCAPATLKIS